ncbi:hypothetical protein LCGC14_1473280 [marine sediment metagenome]|uniref:Helicase ATP-binding domain-containing protein n=1 Tax=marine sediment metagenome TaxID=412755 RepID=A0A0F9JCD6_9ZZZZ
MKKPALRPYQQDCLDAINDYGPGKGLIQMAAGAGKSLVFARLPGRPLLVMAHRQELVVQAAGHFGPDTAIEQAERRAPAGAEVVSSSVQTLARRKEKWDPDRFDTVVVDEAHHSAARTYRDILSYFTPRQRLGFTATPNRGDAVSLEDVYDDIIFEYDLFRAIEEGFLSPLRAVRVTIDCDLSKIRTRAGDFALGDLDAAVNIESANKAVAEAVAKHGEPPILVFGCTIEHAKALAAACSKHFGSCDWVSGVSKHRGQALSLFRAGHTDVLCNVALYTEGVDIPNIRTVVIARPTKSQPLYSQMIGRGTRLAPGKDHCIIIDCVDSTHYNDLATACSLAGIDPSEMENPERLEQEPLNVQAWLPAVVGGDSDHPGAWVKNYTTVNLWAKRRNLDLRDIHFFKHPDGRLSVNIATDKWLRISPADLRGRVMVTTPKIERGPFTQQEAIDFAHDLLHKHCADSKPLFSRKSFARWGKQEPTSKQLAQIARMTSKACSPKTKGEASLILNRLFAYYHSHSGRRQMSHIAGPPPPGGVS